MLLKETSNILEELNCLQLHGMRCRK